MERGGVVCIFFLMCVDSLVHVVRISFLGTTQWERLLFFQCCHYIVSQDELSPSRITQQESIQTLILHWKPGNCCILGAGCHQATSSIPTCWQFGLLVYSQPVHCCFSILQIRMLLLSNATPWIEAVHQQTITPTQPHGYRQRFNSLFHHPAFVLVASLPDTVNETLPKNSPIR
jgi:hypothetical protein